MTKMFSVHSVKNEKHMHYDRPCRGRGDPPLILDTDSEDKAFVMGFMGVGGKNPLRITNR